MRKKLTGLLNVYRVSAASETLVAEVNVDEVTTRYFYTPAPKAFKDLIKDASKNLVRVEYIANEDGSNPRAVKAISEPY